MPMSVDSANLMMRTANKGETFKGIGMDAPISLSGVEVVIEDKSSKRLVAVYPYRDSDESKVTEKSKDVLFMMCGVPRVTRDIAPCKQSNHRLCYPFLSLEEAEKWVQILELEVWDFCLGFRWYY